MPKVPDCPSHGAYNLHFDDEIYLENTFNKEVGDIVCRSGDQDQNDSNDNSERSSRLHSVSDSLRQEWIVPLPFLYLVFSKVAEHAVFCIARCSLTDL